MFHRVLWIGGLLAATAASATLAAHGHVVGSDPFVQVGSVTGMLSLTGLAFLVCFPELVG
jgi:hypothetical protein